MCVSEIEGFIDHAAIVVGRNAEQFSSSDLLTSSLPTRPFAPLCSHGSVRAHDGVFSSAWHISAIDDGKRGNEVLLYVTGTEFDDHT